MGLTVILIRLMFRIGFHWLSRSCLRRFVRQASQLIRPRTRSCLFITSLIRILLSLNTALRQLVAIWIKTLRTILSVFLVLEKLPTLVIVKSLSDCGSTLKSSLQMVSHQQMLFSNSKAKTVWFLRVKLVALLLLKVSNTHSLCNCRVA